MSQGWEHRDLRSCTASAAMTRFFPRTVTGRFSVCREKEFKIMPLCVDLPRLYIRTIPTDTPFNSFFLTGRMRTYRPRPVSVSRSGNDLLVHPSTAIFAMVGSAAVLRTARRYVLCPFILILVLKFCKRLYLRHLTQLTIALFLSDRRTGRLGSYTPIRIIVVLLRQREFLIPLSLANRAMSATDTALHAGGSYDQRIGQVVLFDRSFSPARADLPMSVPVIAVLIVRMLEFWEGSDLGFGGTPRAMSGFLSFLRAGGKAINGKILFVVVSQRTHAPHLINVAGLTGPLLLPHQRTGGKFGHSPHAEWVWNDRDTPPVDLAIASAAMA